MTSIGSFSAQAAESAQPVNSLEKLMQRPLILGASVSADRATASPGKRLALRYTKPTEIKTVAIGGMPSTKVLPSVSSKDLADRSIIIGIDLFFWDSTLQTPTASVEALKKLIAQAERMNVPLVVGEVPELIPGMQPSRVAINQAILKQCESSKNCYVMKLDSLLKQVLRDGYLNFKGRKYTLRELVPDGLHIGPIAGEEIANRLAALLEEKGS